MNHIKLFTLLPLMTLALISITQAPVIPVQHDHLRRHENHTSGQSPVMVHKELTSSSHTERLIGESFYAGNNLSYIISDSSYLTYSDGRNFIAPVYFFFLIGPSYPFYTYDLAVPYAFDTVTYLSYDTLGHGMNYIRIVNRYDNNNNPISQTKQQWDTYSNSYVNYQQVTDSFDANNNLLSQAQMQWQTAGNSWLNLSRTLYSYDTHNNQVAMIQQSWDMTNNAYLNENQNIDVYDSLNRQLSDLEQGWNTGTNSWDNQYYDQYSYNSTNKCTNSIYQAWNTASGNWLNYENIIDSFDANNNNTREIGLLWDSISLSWFNYYNTLYTYTSANKIQTEISQAWDTASGQWQNELQWFYTFDANNNQISLVEQSWQVAIWRNLAWDSSAYDNNNNEIYYNSSSWDTIHQLWNYVQQTYQTYDSLNSPTSIMTSSWVDSVGSWLPTTDDLHCHYYYQLYPLGVPDILPAGAMCIYPSPASEKLNIDLSWNEAQAASISIYDLTGRLWRQWETPYGAYYQSDIPVSQLSSGIYYMNVKGSKGQIIKKSFSVLH